MRFNRAQKKSILLQIGKDFRYFGISCVIVPFFLQDQYIKGMVFGISGLVIGIGLEIWTKSKLNTSLARKTKTNEAPG